MGTVETIDRKQLINDRYWNFSITEPEGEAQMRRVVYPESARQIAESLGINVERIKYHVEPKTYTLRVRCRECMRELNVTETLRTRYELDCLYSGTYVCEDCQVERKRKEAEDLAAYNEILREKYGALVVGKCPKCGLFTHIAFDPATVEFYQVCEAGDECFASHLTAARRKSFLPKIIALLQAKAALS